MPLNPGDLMFIGWDSDNNDIAFVATTNLVAGEVIYFTDDEWNGTDWIGNEQLIEWIVPVGGISAGTVITIDMQTSPGTADIDAGGDVDYIRGGGVIAGANEMFWAFQGVRDGTTVDPTNFIAVIGNESSGSNTQTPNLDGTGLDLTNGAIIIDGDNDYMEFDASGLPSPVTQSELIAAISDTNDWILGNGRGDNNPNPGGGFVMTDPLVVCFVAGTMIKTPSGEKPVETLRIGDLVNTVDNGPQPIGWIATSHIHAAPSQSPVLFCEGSIGNTRDLLVSPQHRMVVSGPMPNLLFGASEVLVPAKALVNGHDILQCAPGHVEYVHAMFAKHEIIYAEGVPSESFYPGRQSLKTLNSGAKAELFRAFPDLIEDPEAYGKLARVSVSAKQAALLVNAPSPTLAATAGYASL